MLNFAKIMPLILCLFTLGCGKDGSNKGESKSQNEDIYGNNAFTLIDPGSLQTSQSGVKGIGKLIYNVPLKNSDNNYTFSLALEDRGSLEVVTNADKTLRDGVSLKFVRANKSLKVTLTVKGNTADISPLFDKLDASTNVTLSIDIHNSESPAHILIWAADSDYSKESALFNSEEHGEIAGQGVGKFWGFDLHNTSVERPVASEPKFSEA